MTVSRALPPNNKLAENIENLNDCVSYRSLRNELDNFSENTRGFKKNTARTKVNDFAKTLTSADFNTMDASRSGKHINEVSSDKCVSEKEAVHYVI